MKNVLLVFCLLFAVALNANAQNASAPAYKLTKIKIIPFDQSRGEFDAEVPANETPYYLNALDKSFFVSVEISGKKDSFEAARKVEITVHEGAKLKSQRTAEIGYIGDNGKVYVPVMLYGTYCSDVTIKARIIGQKTPSQLTRKMSFNCGE